MPKKIFITRKLPESIVTKLSAYGLVEMWEEEDTPIPKSILMEKIKDVDGILSLLTETIDKEVMERANKLKVISNMAVGYNNIDVEEATRRGIMVTNTPGVLTETTADLTFSLMMATARRLNEAEHVLKRGEWKTWSPFFLTGQDIYGSTLGIIGLGQIGQAVAKRAKGFDMNILYYNRTRKLAAEEALGIQYTDFETILRQSDFVVLLVPLTNETKNLIGKNELSLMKKNAVLINTSRGGVVDESALYDALIGGQIWGAGLDVFEEEPVSVNHHLLTLKNVVALPHIGSASVKTRMRMADLAANHLIQAINGEVPTYLVNKDVL